MSFILPSEAFHFETLIDSEVARIVQNVLCTLPKRPPVVTSNITAVHYQNQETDVGTLVLTRWQISLVFTIF